MCPAPEIVTSPPCGMPSRMRAATVAGNASLSAPRRTSVGRFTASKNGQRPGRGGTVPVRRWSLIILS
jgi:hypothetical protein